MPGPTSAQSQSGSDVITLRSFDGFTQLRGQLKNFDGTTYTIETALGTILIDALQVECEGEACPQSLLYGAAFGIHGSNTIGAQLMPALIEGYADTLDASTVVEIIGNDHRVLRIVGKDGREMAAVDLQSRGSSFSFTALAGGSAEIGMSSRRARDRDVPVLATGGLADPRNTEREHVIALDGLIAIVHPDNPVRSLSLEELALAFSGVVTNWTEFGGPDAPINLHAAAEESGTFQTFSSLVLTPFDLTAAPQARRYTSSIQLSDSVAADPLGLGVTAAAFERAARALPIRQECGILTYPTEFAMKTEEYPLARRLYLYTPRQQMTAHASQLIEFAKSESAQALVAEAGFVNLAVEQSMLNEQGARIVHALTGEDEVSVPLLRQMLNEIKDAARLSQTFRFNPGSSQLDRRSEGDITLLAKDIAAGVYQGKELLLIGFTDSIGQFELNRGLSARRAQVVLDRIRESIPGIDIGNTELSVKGYGELTPVGCNTTVAGRSANRRVEVWVRDLPRN